jgi:hypothetical protein
MMSGRWQRRAAFFLLVIYCLDLAWKLADWHDTFSDLSWWGIALGLTFRFAFMGFLLYIYSRLKKTPQEETVITQSMMRAAVRHMRIDHIILLAAIIGYVFVAEKLFKPTTDAPALLVETFAVLAVVMVVIALTYRRQLLPQAIEGLQRGDATALVRWRKANLVSMVLAVAWRCMGLPYALWVLAVELRGRSSLARYH